MTITLIVTKLHLAIAVFAIALLAPATAMAVDSWSDTPDDAFYHDAVTWAKGNGMTAGCNDGTGFCPDRIVTRGENITFAHRYDTLVVQPALTSLTTAQPFTTTGYESNGFLLVSAPTAYVTVTVTAPVAGHIVVNSTAVVRHSVDGGDIRCVIVESTDIPIANVSANAEGAQYHETGGSGTDSTLSGSRFFEIAAGATVEYVLACRETMDGGFIFGPNLTALFTPAP